MKKTRKFMSSICAIGLAVAFTAGCGAKETETAPAPEANNIPAASAPAASTETPPTESDIDWPTKPLTIIVPASAGGGTDVSCRLITKYLTEELGQPVTITNIKGAGGSTGMGEAKNAANDGYTALYIHEDIVTNQVLGVSDFGFRDFEIVGKVFDVELITILTSKKYETLDDLRAAAEANPGEISFGIDIATSAHFVPLLMEEAMGIDLKLVDAGSMNDRLPLLVSGQLDCTFAPLGIVKDYVENGDINCVGVISDKRSELKPDLPTLKEQGCDVVSHKYFGFYFPAGTDQHIVNKLAAAIEAVCENPDFIKEVNDILYDVKFGDAAEMQALLEESEAVMTAKRDLVLAG